MASFYKAPFLTSTYKRSGEVNSQLRVLPGMDTEWSDVPNNTTARQNEHEFAQQVFSNNPVTATETRQRVPQALNRTCNRHGTYEVVGMGHAWHQPQPGRGATKARKSSDFPKNTHSAHRRLIGTPRPHVCPSPRLLEALQLPGPPQMSAAGCHPSCDDAGGRASLAHTSPTIA